MAAAKNVEPAPARIAEPPIGHIDVGPAPGGYRELRRGVSEIHVGNNRQLVGARSIEDDLAQLRSPLFGVPHRTPYEKASEHL